MSAPGDPLASDLAYCRRCGAARPAGATVCPACGLDHSIDAGQDGGLGRQSRAQPRPGAARTQGRTSAAALAKVAGLVWLLLAIASGVGFVLELLGGGSVASWIGFSAGLESLTGLGLFLWPTWEMLTAATLWGALSVIGTLMQVANGRTPGTTAAMLVTGIALAASLSFVARQRLPPAAD